MCINYSQLEWYWLLSFIAFYIGVSMKAKDVCIFWDWIVQSLEGIKTNEEYVPNWDMLPSHLWEEAEEVLDRELAKL